MRVADAFAINYFMDAVNERFSKFIPIIIFMVFAYCSSYIKQKTATLIEKRRHFMSEERFMREILQEAAELRQLRALASYRTDSAGDGGSDRPPSRSPPSIPTGASTLPKDKVNAFFFALEDGVLDYKRNSVSCIEACITRFVDLLDSVLRLCEGLPSPDNDEKKEEAAARVVRHISARSDEIRPVLQVKGGEKLLLCSGWVPAVRSLEKGYAFRARRTDVELAKEALRLTRKALVTVTSKKAFNTLNREKEKEAEAAQKQKVIDDFENDKRERAAFRAAASG